MEANDNAASKFADRLVDLVDGHMPLDDDERDVIRRYSKELLAESMVNALPVDQQNLLMQNTRSTHGGETEPEREVERHTVNCGGHREWTVDIHPDGTCEIRDDRGHIAHKSDSHKSTAIHFAMALDGLRQAREGFTRLYEAKGNGSSE